MVKFYPNPAIHFITFEYLGKPTQGQTVVIFNFLGKKVAEEPLVQQKTTVNIADLYRGMYIFQIRDRDGQILDSGKFQITK